MLGRAFLRRHAVLVVVALLGSLPCWNVSRAASGQRKPSPEPTYRSPVDVAIQPDGGLALTANETSGTVSLIDLANRRVAKEIPIGKRPTAVAFDRSGNRAAITCRYQDEVVILGVPRLRVLARISTPNQPYDVVWLDEHRLAVSCTGKDEAVAIVDLDSGQVEHVITVPQNPKALLLLSDRRTLAVACDCYDITREIALIDLRSLKVTARIQINPASNLAGLCEVAPNVLVATHLVPKPFVPLTQVRQGWVNNNALSVVFLDRNPPSVVTLYLDDVHRYFANPAGIALSRDGKYLSIACAGVDEVILLDAPALVRLARKLSGEDPGGGLRLQAVRPLRRGIVPVGRNPRSVALAGEMLVVANRLSDSVHLVRLDSAAKPAEIRLGNTETITQLRRGEILFNSASICFQRQFSCASCHPEGHTTGLSWDLEDDGLGIIKNIKSFRGISGTAPFRWQGEAAEVGANECGPTVALAMRGSPLSDEDLNALEAFVLSIEPPPNPYRRPDGTLTEQAERGKRLFEGKAGCIKCHNGPRFTNGKRRDVGTGIGRREPLTLPNGRTIYPSQFDVPRLVGVWDSPPYLHDGRAKTIRDVLTTFNPEDKHGNCADLSPAELEDLIAYVLSL